MRASWRNVVYSLTALLLIAVAAAGDAAVPGHPQVAGWAAGTAIAEIAQQDPAMAERLHDYEDLLRPIDQVSQPIPSDPVEALIAATDGLAQALGFAQDSRRQILAAGIPAEVAGRLALLLERMHTCHLATAEHHEELIRLLPALFRDESVLSTLNYPDIVDCAGKLWLATRELELALTSTVPIQTTAGGCVPLRSGSVDLWPVLRLEPNCDSQTYTHDYLLVVDVGGDDVYANNVGSNVIDINFSPPGAAVAGLMGTGPAKGCQRGLSGLYRKDCFLSAAVLLDLAGADSYGVLEPPDSDRVCTEDPVVRRMLTGGAAFLGVGILRDAAASDDRYVAKTVSLGAGHLFGIGVLSDAGGDDTYSAVRNSLGFSLMGGLGLLHDQGGDDTYGYYMPSPLDPSAPNQTDGAGGVRDNEGDGVCDRVPRYTLGSGNLLGAVGVLIDEGGNDRYHGAFSDRYVTNPPIPGMSLTGGCMGYGGNGGFGFFLDRSGEDTYLADNVDSQEFKRANGIVLQPGDPSTGAVGRAMFAGGQGIFIDR